MPSHAKRCREANGEPFVTRSKKEDSDYKRQCARAAEHRQAMEADPVDGLRLHKMKGREKDHK